MAQRLATKYTPESPKKILLFKLKYINIKINTNKLIIRNESKVLFLNNIKSKNPMNKLEDSPFNPSIIFIAF